MPGKLLIWKEFEPVGAGRPAPGRSGAGGPAGRLCI